MANRKGNRTPGSRVGNGAGKGDGWGGQPRGYSRVRFIEGNTAATDCAGDTRKAKQALREQRTEALEDQLYALAFEAERQETQVQAASRLHAIYNGMPVQATITHTTDDLGSMSDADLRDELARLARESGLAGEGSPPKGLPN